MTRIEERLRDALQASAARVRDDRLRPLSAPEASQAPEASKAPEAWGAWDATGAPEPGAGRRAGRRQAWRAWLIPAAAAAAVVLVIGLVVAVTGGLRHATGRGPSGPASQEATSSRMPGYFVRIAGTGASNRVEVQSSSTGAVVATVLPPRPPPGGTLDYEAVAAAPDDRTFYVEYEAISRPVLQTWILSFSLTASGSATPLSMVKGGLLNGQAAGLETWGNLAVSPDGTRLALTVDSSDHISDTSPGYSDKIIMIDLRTGQHTVWQGGLDRPGKTFSIPDLSWAADGQSLVFLGQWCAAMLAPACTGTLAPGGYRDAQVWSLSTATGGGPLSRGRLLLRESARHPLIAQAYGGPRGSDLTVAVLSGQVNQLGEWPELTVEDVSADGSTRSVDYRISRAQGLGGLPQQVWLTADPGGQHLLVSYAVPGGFTIGWIDHGEFHLLPITQPYLPSDATLVIAW